MSESNQEPSFLWYSIAMFYKFSSLPMFVSIGYVCAIAKNWPFVYDTFGVSPFSVICPILVGVLMLILMVENQPSYFKQIYPSHLIDREESFLCHYRIFITSLRWFFLFTVLYLLIINKSLPLCEGSETLARCHWGLFASRWGIVYACLLGLIVLVYVAAVRSIPKEKQD